MAAISCRIRRNRGEIRTDAAAEPPAMKAAVKPRGFGPPRKAICTKSLPLTTDRLRAIRCMTALRSPSSAFRRGAVNPWIFHPSSRTPRICAPQIDAAFSRPQNAWARSLALPRRPPLLSSWRSPSRSRQKGILIARRLSQQQNAAQTLHRRRVRSIGRQRFKRLNDYSKHS